MERPSWILVGVLVAVTWWLAVQHEQAAVFDQNRLKQSYAAGAAVGAIANVLSVAAVPDQLAHEDGLIH